MTEYINKEEILKSSIRTHHYDRERGNAHYIKGVESAMDTLRAFQALDLVFG